MFMAGKGHAIFFFCGISGQIKAVPGAPGTALTCFHPNLRKGICLKPNYSLLKPIINLILFCLGYLICPIPDTRQISLT